MRTCVSMGQHKSACTLIQKNNSTPQPHLLNNSVTFTKTTSWDDKRSLSITTTTSTTRSNTTTTSNDHLGSWETGFETNKNKMMKSRRIVLGERWKEYQGIRNWEGLLDPLDDKLRGEILRYGYFVEAAYRSFDLEHSTCRFPKSTLLHDSGFPGTGYRLTKHLRATSGIKVPRWMKGVCGAQSSWIGYVAVCQDKEEISRLGRRDVVIAYRGTATCLEWLENVRANLTPLNNNINSNTDKDEDEIDTNNNNEGGGAGPMVESGFLSLYTSRGPMGGPSLQDMVKEEIRRLLHSYGGRDHPISVTLTGHSLGAALAALTAYDIKTAFPNAPLLLTVISFGGPRVGNPSFRRLLEKQGANVLRIVNSDDVITRLPGFVLDSSSSNNNDSDNNDQSVSVNEEKEDDNESKGGATLETNRMDKKVAAINNSNNKNTNRGMPSWIRKVVEDTEWVYAEIGRELRLSSRDCPYINSGNVATCHDLKTYLHLVDAFVSSSSPFRPATPLTSPTYHDHHTKYNNNNNKNSICSKQHLQLHSCVKKINTRRSLSLV